MHFLLSAYAGILVTIMFTLFVLFAIKVFGCY